jgi:hypothetical protein
MFSKEMEALIEATLQDGVLTDQEKAVLVKRAQKEGIDVDELDIYIQSLLQKRHQAEAEEDAKNDKQSKIGIMQKCPNCGQTIQSGWAACPACGFAFNIQDELNNSAVKLQEDLNKVSADYRKIIANERDRAKADDLRQQCAVEKNQIIQNVVIGSSRKELLDLLAFARPKANKLGSKKGFELDGAWFKAEDFGYAYWNLYENCINAASASFSSDPAFAQYFAFYEEEKNKKSFIKKIISSIFG